MVKAFVKDHFYYKAKKDGYLARSYYKLQEVDNKYRLIKGGMYVLDLGCAPGSWIEYVLPKVGSRGVIVGVDRNALKKEFGKVKVIQVDVYDVTHEQLLRAGGPFDIVLSDLAPDTSGYSAQDAYRSFELSSRALELAELTLKQKGAFVCKIFQGQEFKDYLERAKLLFDRVNTFKPKSSKKQSREIYVIAKNKR